MHIFVKKKKKKKRKGKKKKKKISKKNILNYHFDEEYLENKITFDYKLKPGKCQKTNAIYLLKLAGVLEN